ncbi:MAG: immune inhibitor A [Thermoflexales bacterium]|nr:immune inhibitor A [Thermoflexales bacterium]MBP8241039.1 immune inhibitor A [Thermoflexales bacterium]
MKQNTWLLILIGVLVACLCLSCVGGGGALAYLLSQSDSGQINPTVAPGFPSPIGPRPTATRASTAPTATPRALDRTPLPPLTKAGDQASLDAAVNTPLPPEDLPAIAVRFKGVDAAQTGRACPTESKGYEVGATRSFTLSNQDDNTQFAIKAELRYKTPNVYMWVQSGSTQVKIDDTKLRKAADTFDQKIIPTNRAFFGTEASPGVDCDRHLYIVHAAGIGKTVGGYFSSPDGFTRAVRSDSNEAEMFVVHAAPGYNGANPGSDTYMSTLAHEFQHMISHNATTGPSLWLEEGASQLAERLNGYPEIETVFSFASQPDTQLNTWSESSAGENSAHYGGGYLFWSFLYDRAGEALTRKLAQTRERSPQAFMKVLAENGFFNPDTGKPYAFAEFFADFAAANYLGKTKADGGTRFSYKSIDVPPMTQNGSLKRADYPYEESEQVNQFGTQYLELTGDAPLTINFEGSNTVPLIPTTDADGTYWYSNRADQSNPRLTREFDLTKILKATLKYRAWYRMEKDWDYGYVSASTDNGATWKILKTPTCVTSNPSGANLGCGYTGPSGGTKDPRWINESVDLSAYSGKKILIRWELITDAGVNRDGLAIDNIEVPELGFKDDVSQPGDWQAEGFIRVTTLVPQTWQVQLITYNNDGTVNVKRMPLDNNAGSLKLDLGRAGQAKRGVLAVSATTLVTTEPGSYRLSITQP